MVCKRCKRDVAMYARDMCHECYSKGTYGRRLFYRTSRPLTTEQVDHNFDVIYKQFRKKKIKQEKGQEERERFK